MPVLGTSISMGSVLLAGALPQAAGQPVLSSPSTNLTDTKSSSGDREAFLQTMRNDMDHGEKEAPSRFEPVTFA